MSEVAAAWALHAAHGAHRSSAPGATQAIVLILLCIWPGAQSRAEPAVTLYGIVDAAASYSRSGDGMSRVEMRSGQASGSRFGVRGNEPLGGELQVLFNLEAGFDVDTGAGDGPRGGLAWNRQSWVGLQSAWGAILLGRQYRPETRAVFVMDPFDGSSVASPPNTWSDLIYRADNAVLYETPELGNWQALFMVAPGEQPEGVRGARDDRGFALLYRSGPLRMAFGWDRRVNAEADDGRVWQSIGGSYEVRDVTLYGAFRKRSEDRAGLDERSHWIGASMPLGLFVLRGVLGKLDDRSGERRNTTALGLGAEYRMSRRTDLYGRYARLRNRNGARFDLGGGIEGSAPQTLALGLRVRF